jgi:hypothetical protein
MQKSRELPFERGAGDGFYWASSGLVYETSQNYPQVSDLPAQFAIGLANAVSYNAVPNFIGTQTVSSTEKPRPLFNNFNNYRVRGVELPYTFCNETYNTTNPQRYVYAAFTRMSVSSGSDPEDAIPTNPGTYWRLCDGAQRRAWWSMQPRFEGEFQALNFIYELKDFKDIAKHIVKISPSKILNNVKSLKRKLTYASKRVAQGSTSSTLVRTASQATKTMAEVHLAKVFAVDPTVRDLVTLHGQLITLINDVQQEFFDRGLDTQSSHYTESVYETSNLPVYYDRNKYWVRLGTRQAVKFTATMQYRYEYQMRSWFDALKRYYGLNVNAGVVWNALPFSFVLDYFLKVGQAIDFMRIDPNVELRLMQYCESLLSEASTGWHYVPDPRASILINGGTIRKNSDDISPYPYDLFCGYKGDWYTRNVTTPNKGAALPRLTLPSSKQVTNLVALLRAMW